MRIQNKFSILFMGLILFLCSSQLSAQDFIVVVNKSNPVSSLKKVELKLYYMKKLKKQWPQTGEDILPVGIATENQAKQAFLKGIMKMSDDQLDAYFDQRQFANGEAPPEKFDTEEQVIQYVSENAGSIGYVSKAAFDRAGGAVKAVSVN